MGDNTYNQYKCADSNYGTIEPCGIPGQFCFTSFTDWDGDGGMVQFYQIKEFRTKFRPEYNYALKFEN